MNLFQNPADGSLQAASHTHKELARALAELLRVGVLADAPVEGIDVEGHVLWGMTLRILDGFLAHAGAR